MNSMNEKNSYNIDFEFIEKVVRLVEEADIGELEVEAPEGIRLVVKKSTPNLITSTQMMPQMMPAASAAAPAASPEVTQPVQDDASIEVIKAPMVGTFYRAPAPDSPPFVDVGSSIQNSTVVCILEAMKVMNEIKAGVTGTVTEILVENGQPVEFGQPLFKIKKV